MNRWLLIGSLTLMLFSSTGCQMCGPCNDGAGGPGTCNEPYGQCGDCGHGNASRPVGVIGKLKAHGGCGLCGTDHHCNSHGSGILGRMCGMCGFGKCLGGSCQGNGECGGSCGVPGGCRTGCPASPIGWQQGGLDYSSHLQAGACGHDAPAALNNRPFTPGPPTAQVGYPYYSHHGPRDFLLDNPPTLGR